MRPLLLVLMSFRLAAQPPDVAVHRDLVYGQGSGQDLKLDLYLPQAATRPAPLVLWVHGGGWRQGSKAQPPARWLLSKGYALASIDYRLSSVATFPAQLDDCRAALAWLRSHASRYGLNANRVGAWGASAGGHLVALLGTIDNVQAVVDFFGPTDLLKMSAFPSRIDHDAPNSPESLLIGGPIQQNRERAEKANPLRYISPRTAPFLIVHGSDDPLVPPNQSEILHAALQKAGRESTLTILPGAGHGGPPFDSPEVREMVEKFFERHLKR